MDSEIVKELIISPRGDRVREDLEDAAGWGSYATALRQALGAVFARSGVDLLEVGGLLVNEPLPDRHTGLRNGGNVRLAQAIDIVEGMAAGRGPYCQLSVAGRLQIESGWDGAVHIYMTRSDAADLASLQCRDAILRWREAVPDRAVISEQVDAVADESFWEMVANASERTTLLCERWAYGAYGCRWFRVTQENAAELADLMQPRSLVCVACDPVLHPRFEILMDDFTAFRAPLLPGELYYRPFPGGADELSELTVAGFTFMLADSALSDWCAVVPDSDGVNRAQWESPGARY